MKQNIFKIPLSFRNFIETPFSDDPITSDEIFYDLNSNNPSLICHGFHLIRQFVHSNPMNETLYEKFFNCCVQHLNDCYEQYNLSLILGDVATIQVLLSNPSTLLLSSQNGCIDRLFNLLDNFADHIVYISLQCLTIIFDAMNQEDIPLFFI